MVEYWTMKTGEKIRIKDMETSHIYNTLKMLERNVKNYRIQLCELNEYDMNFTVYLSLLSDEELLRKHTAYNDLEKEYNAR